MNRKDKSGPSAKGDLSWFIFVTATTALSIVSILASVRLTSDSLFLDDLYESLMSGSSMFNSWTLTAAPAYLDIGSYFAISSIVKDTALRIGLTSVLQSIALLAAVYYLLRALKYSPRLSFGVAAVTTAFLAVASGSTNLWLFFSSTNNHFSVVVIGLVQLALLEKHKKSQRISLRVFAAQATLSAIGSMCSPIHLLAVIGPLLLVIIAEKLSATRNIFTAIRKSNLTWLPLILGGSLWFFLKEHLIFNDILGGRVQPSLDNSLRSVASYAQETINVFIEGNPYIVMATVAVMASFVFNSRNWITLRRIDSARTGGAAETGRGGLMEAFSIISFVSTLILSCASGGAVDLFSFRYLALPAIVSVTIALARFWGTKPNQHLKSSILLATSLCLALSIAPIKASLQVISGVARTSLSECVTEAKVHFPLKDGASQYWNARRTSYDFDWKQRIVPVLNTMEPFFWMTNTTYLRGDATSEVNFLIVDSGMDAGPFGFSPLNLSATIPPPSDKFFCDGGENEIWYFDSGVLNDFYLLKARETLPESR